MVMVVMAPGPAHALQVLLQGGESLLRPGEVPGAEGICEGFKIFATLAHRGALAGRTAGLGCL